MGGKWRREESGPLAIPEQRNQPWTALLPTWLHTETLNPLPEEGTRDWISNCSETEVFRVHKNTSKCKCTRCTKI